MWPFLLSCEKLFRDKEGFCVKSIEGIIFRALLMFEMTDIRLFN